MVSQGVPMLSHGDEMGRTQGGNNNAYCQDNEITWIDWELDERRRRLLEFTAKAIAFRLAQPALRRRKYFHGRAIRGGGIKDVAWLTPDGQEMSDEAWNADFVRSLGMLLAGNAIEEVDEQGEPVVGDSLLVLLNAHSDTVPFALPEVDADHRWQRVFDTADPDASESLFASGVKYPLEGRSVVVFKIAPPLRERRRPERPAHAAVPQEPVSALAPDPSVPTGVES
jgi:glycogen operon protein